MLLHSGKTKYLLREIKIFCFTSEEEQEEDEEQEKECPQNAVVHLLFLVGPIIPIPNATH